MAHPCCGSSLQTGTKILAIIDLVVGISALVYLIITVVDVIASHHEIVKKLDKNIQKEIKPDDVYLIATVVLFIVISSSILSIILSVILLLGAIQRNLTKCKVWYCVISILCIVYAISILTASDITNIIVQLISIAFRLYTMWVVWAFMEELKSGSG